VARKPKAYSKSIRVKPTSEPTTQKGEISINKNDNKLKVTTEVPADFQTMQVYTVGEKVRYTDGINYICTQLTTGSQNPTDAAYWEVYQRSIVTEDQTQTLTNKTIDADSNTISNLEVDNFKASAIKTDGTLNNASDTELPTALAVKTYVDNAGNGEIDASEIVYTPDSSDGWGCEPSEVKGALDDLNERAINIDADLTNHIGSSTAHEAASITFTGTMPDWASDPGDVDNALNDLNLRVNSADGIAESANDEAIALRTLSGTTTGDTDLGTFTGATIADNTTTKDALQSLETSLESHTGAFTGVHGVTGSVVGTTDTQDLSNKTFTDAVTLEELAVTPSNPSAGDKKFYAKTDGKVYTLDSAGNEVEIGSGAEAIETVYDPSGNPETTATNVQDALDDTGTSVSIQSALLSAHTSASSGVHGVTGDVVGTTDTQDLSNKTITDALTLEEQASTPSNPAVGDKKLYAKNDGKVYTLDSDGNEVEVGAGGGSTQFEIIQTTHGLIVGEGIYYDSMSTSWVKGLADNADTLAYYVVVEVIDADTFVAADFGRIEVNTLTNPNSLAAGSYYFLSDTVSGEPTSTEPSSFSNPLFFVESVNSSDPSNILAILQVKCLRPEVVGDDTFLDDLSDVSASAATEGDIIKYNGASWVAQKQDQQVISLIAAQNIAIRDALFVNGSGQVDLLDSDDDAKIEFIGFAREAGIAAQSLEVVISGKLGGFSGLTPGELVYADPTTPGAIVQPEPTQANVYLIKVGKAISTTEILVNPDLAASAEFNREVVADQTITNNQSTPDPITGLSFDGAIYRAVVLRYAIYRVTDTNEVAQTGQLRLTYKTNAMSWSISDDFGGDDAGVTFSIDATGQILYTSTDLTGTGYSSSLKVNTVELFEI
jgi:hypothetical protein